MTSYQCKHNSEPETSHIFSFESNSLKLSGLGTQLANFLFYFQIVLWACEHRNTHQKLGFFKDQMILCTVPTWLRPSSFQRSNMFLFVMICLDCYKCRSRDLTQCTMHRMSHFWYFGTVDLTIVACRCRSNLSMYPKLIVGTQWQIHYGSF